MARFSDRYGTTLNPANSVEYAYNSSGITAAATSDTTSFAYGSEGAAIGAIASTSASSNTGFRVRFKTPATQDDQITLELQYVGGPWLPVETIGGVACAFTFQGASQYGIHLGPIGGSNTDFEVLFGNMGRAITNPTFAGAGSSWAGISTTRWRVKKTRALSPAGVNNLAGSIVTDYVPYTPTIGNLSATIQSAKWRRIGTAMEISVTIAPTALATGFVRIFYPPGFTYQETSGAIVGSGLYANASAQYTGSAIHQGAYAEIAGDGHAGSYGWGTTNPTGSGVTTGSVLSVRLTLQVADWASAGVFQGAGNVIEYAYNSSTTATDDLTSFASGQNGAPIYNFAPSGTTPVTKRVQFSTPIQPDDLVLLELYDSTGGVWFPYNFRLPGLSMNDAGNAYYGALNVAISSTQLDVRFFSAPYPGTTWATFSTLRWRVRKCKANAPAGFGPASPSEQGFITTLAQTISGDKTLTGVTRLGSYTASGSHSVLSSTNVPLAIDSANAQPFILLKHTSGTVGAYLGYNGTNAFEVRNSGLTAVFQLTQTGAPTFPFLHNNPTPSNIASGRTALSAVASTNVASVALGQCMYSRVGNIVTVSVSGAVQMTSANVGSQFFVTLPIASNFTTGADVIGAGTRDSTTTTSAIIILGDVASKRAVCTFISAYAPNATMTLQFQYEVK